MSLAFVALGVGDAFSSRHYSACLAVHAAGRFLLVDCPHPILKIVAEASASAGVAHDLEALEAVVLTHLHADHCSGLESLAYFSHFVLGRRVRLAAHPDVVARLWDGHLAAGMERLLDAATLAPRALAFEDFFEWIPLSTAVAVAVGPFSIRCRPTIHHVPTTALRIAAAGATLGYSADTTFDAELVAWLAEADLVVHETGYGVHTPLSRLAALPPDLRARMRLIHYPDTLAIDPGVIAPLVQGGRTEVERRRP